MISIKKFLGSEGAVSGEAFERMARLLLQAIGLHIVEGERGDLDNFQATIAGTQTSIDNDPSPENILVAAGSAVGALQNYNRRTSIFVRAQATELQAIVGMLTQAMAQISSGSQTSILRLQELQKQIEHAAMADDIRTLRGRLSECLESIRIEVKRQREESSQALSSLREGLQKAQQEKPVGMIEAGDPVTGLPRRADAEAALAVECEKGSHVYCGLFILERVLAVNTRFGQRLGDQMLVFFAQYLSQAMAPADRLFRWNDASFLALLDRRETVEQVRRELGKFLSRRLEPQFQIDGRSVVLPVASTWVVTPLFERKYADILQKLDAFCESLHLV